MLSQKTRYAIRAMQHLADRYGEGPVQLAEIAAAQKIPANFLTTILSELGRFGIVDSLRGKDGGYWLALSPVDITYGDLIRVMRGSARAGAVRQPLRAREVQELPRGGRLPHARADAAGARPHRRAARFDPPVGPDRARSRARIFR